MSKYTFENYSKLSLSIEVLAFLYANTSFIKSAELSQKFGLSNRSIRRLISELRDVGYDIISTSGRYGGYKLNRGSIILPVTINKDKKQAFLNIENTVKGSDLPNKAEALQLLHIIGIQSQLSSELSTEVYYTKKLMEKVKVNIEETYQCLMTAINNKQRVEIKYQSLNKDKDALVWKEFRPERFQVYDNKIYIKGYYNTKSESFRTLRLSRFQAIRLIDKKYSFNENFDKDNDQSAFSEAVYKTYAVKLKILKGNHDLLDYEYGQNQKIIEFEDHYLLTFNLAGDLVIKELVLSMGVYCTLIEPVSIRNEIIKDLKIINNKYI